MIRLVKLVLPALLVAVAAPHPSRAVEPFEGVWKTKAGTEALIDRCGSSCCITLCTGPFAGMLIGRVSGSGASYSGTITDPEDNRTYLGYGTVKGSALELKGCAFMVFCQTQIWDRLQNLDPNHSPVCAKTPFIGA